MYREAATVPLPTATPEMRYRIKTDAFGSPRYMGGTLDGDPVWVSREMAWCFDAQSAFDILPLMQEATLEAESPTPNFAALRVALWAD